MGQTAIQWSDFTFNPLWGCVKISPGCKFCYAEKLDKYVGGKVKHWGPGSPRREFGVGHWLEPHKWQAKAAKDGRIYRVFCSSMADWLEDHPAWVEPRRRLEALVAATPNLIWLFLTKRPENYRLMPAAWLAQWPKNAMFGISGEDNEYFYDRGWTAVENLPASVPLFLSAEPLLGPIRQEHLLCMFRWVIVGGESGNGARPMHPDWALSLRDQCNAAGVPFFFKQWGEWRHVSVEYMLEKRLPIPFEKVGKKAAGRLLGGREWNELPKYWPSNVGLLEKPEKLEVLA